MAFYKILKNYSADKSNRIADRLINLRKDLDSHISAGRTNKSLIIGSWNIRAFDGGRARRDESFHYIAEIIDRFDICAIQEVKVDLAPLRRLVRLLGPNWGYFVSDITTGDRGNNERMAFLYNKNRVFFRHLIGELVLPRDGLIAGNQIARTPFFASFQSGWFRFTLCASHITFDKNEFREREISAIAGVLKKRAKAEDEVYIFLGDMNIDSEEDATFKALLDNDLTVPLFGETNLAGGKHFDQITFTGNAKKTELIRHGVFDWRSSVYMPEDKEHYKPIAEEMRGGQPYANWSDKTYRSWTTGEMSDHLPIWIEIGADYSDEYLGKFL